MLPETCNNLYCSALSVSRPHTVPHAHLSARKLIGADEKEATINECAAKRANGFNYQASDVLKITTALVARWNRFQQAV